MAPMSGEPNIQLAVYHLVSGEEAVVAGGDAAVVIDIQLAVYHFDPSERPVVFGADGTVATDIQEPVYHLDRAVRLEAASIAVDAAREPSVRGQHEDVEAGGHAGGVQADADHAAAAAVALQGPVEHADTVGVGGVRHRLRGGVAVVRIRGVREEEVLGAGGADEEEVVPATSAARSGPRDGECGRRGDTEFVVERCPVAGAGGDDVDPNHRA